MPDRERILEAAREAVAGMTGKNPRDTDSLVASGLIDSLSIITLINQMEKKLGIRIATANLQPDDFETIEWIADTVERSA